MWLNANATSGVKTGDTYRISTVVRTLIDPSTGLLLDAIEREVGQVEIVEVTEHYARAVLVDGARVKRGDFVQL